ncbi:MAG: hypothetical protein K0R31_864 [Clostridiales bacterium]|nr:hypothetical protein [Clostridiales bacterium]
MSQKYLLLSDPGQYSIEEIEFSDLAKEGVIIQVLAVPITIEDYQVFTDKEDNKQIVPGSEAVGKVVYVSDEIKAEVDIDKGDIVYVEPVIPCRECFYCLNGEYAVCKTNRRYGSELNMGKNRILGSYSGYMSLLEGTRIHKIESDIDPELIALSGVLARAARALSKKADGKIGMKVGVIGTSLFGLCCCAVASSMGMKSVIIDDDSFEGKLEFLKLFTDSYINSNALSKISLDENSKQLSESLDVLVVDKPELLPIVIKMLKPQGTVIIPYWIKVKNELPLSLMLSKEQKIVGLKDQAWDFEQAAKLIKDRKEVLRKLLNAGYSLADIKLAMEQYKANGLQLTWIKTN